MAAVGVAALGIVGGGVYYLGYEAVALAADVAADGVAAETAGTVTTVGNVFQDGTMIERSYSFGSTTVGVLGDVSVSGTNLSISNLAVYADSAGTVNLGTGSVLSMVNSFSSEAAADGFTSLTLSGLRYGGANAGKLVTITRTLGGP